MNSTARAKVSWAVLVLLAAAVWSVASSASADSPYVVGYYGYPSWSVYGREHIPYFAKHPPVYYSYPVPRAYGFSPYAYPPGTTTPELLPARPAVFRTSPYRPRAVSAPAPVEKPRPKPLRIKNPYID